MRSAGKNYLKILLAVLLACGLIYAFYNVLTSRIRGQENAKQMESVSGSVLRQMNQAQRMQCMTSVYLETGEEQKQDDSQKVKIIHDFEYDRVYVERKDRSEIFEYKDNVPYIYSKGVSPVYNKSSVKMQMVSKNKWYKYASESMYGTPWENGESDQISYGYLKNQKYLFKIQKQGKDTIDEKEYTKYKAVIKSPLQNEMPNGKSDNGFRKILSFHGLNVMNLKKGYPEVYSMLKKIYNQDTEVMYVWADEEGNLARIEKEHTFLYYLDIMKENSEKIEEKAGQFGYPRVYCRQDYTYSPRCEVIEMPKEFSEL